MTETNVGVLLARLHGAEERECRWRREAMDAHDRLSMAKSMVWVLVVVCVALMVTLVAAPDAACGQLVTTPEVW